MASRPEAAYAAAEVTPKWVLISWHHLLSPSVIIPGEDTLVKGLRLRPGQNVTVEVDDVSAPRRSPGPARRRPGSAGPFRLALHICGVANAVLRRRDRRRLVRHGLGLGGGGARHPPSA